MFGNALLSVRQLLVDNPHLCLSGGAPGADTVWGVAARAAQHNVIHFSFANHRVQHTDAHIVVLNGVQLARANAALACANEILQRRWPTRDDYVNNLLRRNWYQINRTHGVYAVAPVDTTRHVVEGGTGWAVQMYLDALNTASPRRLWVWDTRTAHWMTRRNHRWVPCEPPPRPAGIYTAIGTRAISAAGIAAIHALYQGPHS